MSQLGLPVQGRDTLFSYRNDYTKISTPLYNNLIKYCRY